MEFDAINDLKLTKKMLNLSDLELSSQLGISRTTLDRWVNHEATLTSRSLKTIYDFIYAKRIGINRIKTQFFQEDYSTGGTKVLFHGSKSGIVGGLSANKSKRSNDFGPGFYCGETFEQAAMFASAYQASSVYILSFSDRNLKALTFEVNTKWMIAIAFFRGRLEEYKDSKIIKAIKEEVEAADYIVAPIVDNKMFSIIGNFIDGEITDETCKHCLSATDLGSQYVLLDQKAISKATLLSKCYLADQEKIDYLKGREESIRVGNDKVKAARIKYAREGRYIDEVMGERGL